MPYGGTSKPFCLLNRSQWRSGQSVTVSSHSIQKGSHWIRPSSMPICTTHSLSTIFICSMIYRFVTLKSLNLHVLHFNKLSISCYFRFLYCFNSCSYLMILNIFEKASRHIFYYCYHYMFYTLSSLLYVCHIYYCQLTSLFFSNSKFQNLSETD
jgi:hypothetical protein